METLRKILRAGSWRSIGTATIGQALNFVAMVLPVIAAQGGQLAALVFPLALAALLFKIATLSFHVRYLTLSQGKELATATSLLGLLLVSATTAAAGLGLGLIPGLPASIVDVALWTSVLTLSHGIYYMAVSVAIAEERVEDYGRARILYGVINIVATAAVVFVFPFRSGLLAVALLITSVTGLWLASRCSNNLFCPMVIYCRQALGASGWEYARRSVSITSSTVFADLGFQIQGLVTPLLGGYQELWAVVVRLSGGFGTLGQQVVAPVFDMKTSAAVRVGDGAGMRSWAKRGQVVGAVFALVVAAAQAVVLWLIFHASATAVLIVSVYSLGLLASVVTMKTPYLLGHDRAMMWWSLARVAVSIPLFFLADGALLVALASTQVVLAVVLVIITVVMPPVLDERMAHEPTLL